MHGHPQLFLGQTQCFSQKVPGKLDRLTLEVIAKAEVAQHFKKGVVAGGVAHVFQVIVLAAGAHTALATSRPVIGAWLRTQESILELIHTSIGEQQGGVVTGHQ